MKRTSILAVLALACSALVATDVADARRLGGGRSFGSQRSIAPPSHSTAPSSPSAAPSTPSGAASNPVMPANPSTAAPRAAPAPMAPAPSGMSRWLGPIAGIAAGIGLAALLSHFGLSDGFAGLLLLLLVVFGVVMLVRMFLRRAGPPQPMPYAPATGNTTAPRGFENHVGPTWGAGAAPASVGAATKPPRVPPGFDVDAFVRQAKQQFNRLQAAWDTGDRATLADVMTPAMFAEVERDLAARGTQHPSDIVSLDAEVLEVAQEGGAYVASVRYHGLMREDGATTPQPFDEAWNLQKPVDGSTGWMLAGIQQLEQAS